MTQTKEFSLPETYDVANDLQVFVVITDGVPDVISLALWVKSIPVRLPDELLNVPMILDAALTSAGEAMNDGSLKDGRGWCLPSYNLIRMVIAFLDGTLLNEAIADLADARASTRAADDAYKAVKAAQDEQIAPLVEQRKAARGFEETSYSKVAAIAEAVRAVTGNTNPDPDVLVRQEYPPIYNATNALLWAIENRKDAFLKLDTKSFESNVREGKIPADIATLGRRFKAFITPNLSHRRRQQDAPAE